jgi:hypothetical protein
MSELNWAVEVYIPLFSAPHFTYFVPVCLGGSFNAELGYHNLNTSFQKRTHTFGTLLSFWDVQVLATDTPY